jgi:hypothetical protein
MNHSMIYPLRLTLPMAHLVSFRGQLKLGASQALPRRAHNLAMFAAGSTSTFPNCEDGTRLDK